MDEDHLVKEKEDDVDFTQTIFSWSVDDILIEDLYKYQVEKIPLTFCSEAQYLSSFVYPLLEETRAELADSMEMMYRAPFAEVFSLTEVKRKGKKEFVYDVTVDTWRNRCSEVGKQPYRTLPGDILILADWKPESESDLQQTGRTWAFSLVKTIEDDEDGSSNTSVRFKVQTSQPIESQDEMFAVFLMNITTQKRIWNSLHMNRNSKIIKEILYSDFMVKEKCDVCTSDSSSLSESLDLSLVSKLNESQQAAIMASISKMECCHNSSVEQIWGPPGTGKAMTVSVMISIFLQMKCRTLTCAPTNAAVVQVATRVVSLVKESYKTRIANGDSFYSIGDLLLFGNKERLKVGTEIEEIYLEHRIKRLTECLGSLTGWKHCLRSMIGLLEDCVSQYHVYVENESESEISHVEVEVKSFVDFLRDRFSCSSLPLRTCIVTFCTHVSRSFLTEETFQNMVSLLNILCSLESMLFQDNLVSDELENLFRFKPLESFEDNAQKFGDIQSIRFMSISIMKTLQTSLEKLRFPNFLNKYAMMDFCFQGASLIFCTTSSSYKLHSVKMKPLNFLVIDEAAQLKEAESTIPLQLQGIRHAILIGDECQLPATVKSNVSAAAGFGRSLFDRLSSLGHSKHLVKELEQLDDLVSRKSVLFRHAKWKVLFSDDFRRSFSQLTQSSLKKGVLNLLLKLSGGWRPKNRSVDLCCERSSQIIKQFKVEGVYVICTTDIVKESKYMQVLKIWDLLPFDEISKLTKRLDSIFTAYTDDYISRCTAKSLEGNLEVPMIWPEFQEIIRFRNLSSCEDESDNMNTYSGNDRSYVENSKVSESLLLMKFYSLSSGVVNHLLSGKDIDLPMQVTDEQMDIILFPKSSFIIGRSGTGKTTILTMKLYHNEQTFRIASQGLYEDAVNDAEIDDHRHHEESKPVALRQLFVTVSPKLCHAVKRHVSHLTSVSSDGIGSSSAEINCEDTDVASEFVNMNVDTFIDIPEKSYPLVMTFEKFLMMMDATLGNSFFERFPEAREGSPDNHIISSRSIALKTFIRSRNVTFDKFHSLYWPHFNCNLTKKLDASRVFTEITSHIKGGLQAGETLDGRLTSIGYCSLSQGCASTLTEQTRETVYTLFQTYEKMKTERGEFDWGDLVNDLHHRLKSRKYEGDVMDFVYIDEVQDLSMQQISLFKYICKNVEEGFIFAGDTAQTIARGIDFRFEDIRSLFYTKFLRSGNQEKGRVSEIFQLKQNYRTHVGVLDLAQSVIDILYCYFPHSIDTLEPETSLLSGEAPVLLESGNEENAMATIFGGIGSSSEIVFGAEQLILVRDDSAKIEICKYVGKQALVLTIVECKGLEFQDVLLYNFFGTSPLKDRWRVIYGYMKDRDWLDGKLVNSFPTFRESKHNVLCSELKQLYVSITRTRQRLWICENKEELSKPMFDYWKRRGLVQVKNLDDSVAQAMVVASNPQEWRERGKKLYYENNFVMATMCFERAGDTMWEKLAKASGHRASADQTRGTNQDAYLGHLRKAAKMYESIGKLESAASCYCDMGEYERAGRLYLDKCGKMNEAAECFMLAECYSDAAEAYAKADQFSDCLSVCKKGKFFEKGLEYIEYWKEHVSHQSKEIKQMEQEFLESCALHYHELKDSKSMTKFVRCFCSIESKRAFLRSKGCLDELLLLEEESGHFLDAAELVRSWGDVLKEADLLEKAGMFMDAASLIIWYMFFNSLWGNGNTGWPMKQFSQKDELCERSKKLSKTDSEDFYGFVCQELKLLSDKKSSLSELKRNLQYFQENNSLRGEILSNRKILDAQLCLNSSKYDWEDELPIDLKRHCEEKILQKQVSVRTLVFCWNLWKENVMDIFQSLENLENAEDDVHIDFVLNYFGVRKHHLKGSIHYLLVNKDAEWIKQSWNKGVYRDGKRVTIGSKQLVSAIQSYWQSELLSVGVKVLQTLEALHKLKTKGSSFHQGSCLLHIFEVSKFLLDCSYLKLTFQHTKTLEQSFRISTSYFDIVFPLEWRNSVTEDLISLMGTDLSLNLLEEIILQNVDKKGDLNHWTIGKVMMISLGSRKPVALYKRLTLGTQWNSPWKSFVEGSFNSDLGNDFFVSTLQKALLDAYKANRTSPGYISPDSFLYLMDRLYLMASLSSGIFFTTKSSFLGWFMHLQYSNQNIPLLRSKEKFPVELVENCFETILGILCNKVETLAWIRNSNVNPSSYHPLLVLRLFMMLTLMSFELPHCFQYVSDLLLLRNYIHFLLPQKFLSILKGRKGEIKFSLAKVAEAFMSVNDPVIVVNPGNACKRSHAPCAIFVDLKASREEIMSILFPKKCTRVSQPSSNKTVHETPSSNTNLNVKSLDGCKMDLQLDWKAFEVISESCSQKKGKSLSLSADAIKKEVDKNIKKLTTVLDDEKFSVGEDTMGQAVDAYGELKLISAAFDTSEDKEKHTHFTSDVMKKLLVVVESLKSRRPLIDDLLNKYVMNQDPKVTTKVHHVEEKGNEDSNTDSQVVEKQGNGYDNNHDSKNRKGKGKKKGEKGKGKK